MKLLKISSILMGLFLAVGCGSSNNNGACPAGQSMVNNVCTATNAYGYGTQTGYNNGYGYGTTNTCTASNGQVGVNTASGCLPQGSCQVGYGWTGTTCIVGTTTGYNQNTGCQAGYLMTNMGCLPQGNCQVGMAFSQQYNQCIAAQQGYGQGQGYNNGYNGYGNGYNNGGGMYFGFGYGLGYGQGQQGFGQQGCPRGGYFYNGQMICY